MFKEVLDSPLSEDFRLGLDAFLRDALSPNNLLN